MSHKCEARMSLLSPLDEELNHQTSQPFRVPATTDHRFYDRHWFEAISPDGALTMISGCGIYKNMGVCDGFMSVQHDQRQHNVRMSRALAERITPQVGPLTISVLEPFRRLRVTVEEGDHPLSAELEWTSTFPATLEAPHTQFAGGRASQDISRYGQVGRWCGWTRLDGRPHSCDSCW